MAFALPGLISLTPTAIEGIAALAAAGLAITLAPQAVEAVGHTVEAGAWATKKLWEVTQERPPPPPPPQRPPPIRKEDLKKLAKKAMKRSIKMFLMGATTKMILDKIMEDKEQETVNACGPMENQTQFVDLKLKHQHVWCGHFKSGPPPNNRKYETNSDKVTKDPPEVIWHRGVPPSGSKAAVAYSAHSRQWILAWHVPLRSSSSTANKIYVECGPERPIDWNAIEKRLDASSNESECDGAVAEITDGANARISAIFCEYIE